MSVLKTVGVIGAIGGIGLIGYYYLNKSKPNIAQQQITDIKGEGWTLAQDKPAHRNIWSVVAQYGYDNLDLGQNNRYLDIKNKILTQNPLTLTDNDYILLTSSLSAMNDKGIFEKLVGSDNSKIDAVLWQFVKKTQGIGEEIFGYDQTGDKIKQGINCSYNPSKGEKNPCAYNFTAFPSYVPKTGSPYQLIYANQSNFDNYFKYAPSEYIGYFRELPNPSGEDIKVSAENCIELDRDIKRLIDRIADQTKNNPNSNLTAVLLWFKAILEDYFLIHSCRDKIEKQRLLNIAKTETLSSISQETSVLGKNVKEQNLYLGVGAFVLVASVGILASSGAKTNISTPSVSSNKNSGLGILSDLVIFGGLLGMGYLIFKKPKVVLDNNQNK